ncbi:protein SCAF11 isoform X2 [Hippocampus comes]|uniref:protein SCAF11 isoform X2 n=1 Tax=Hippocampus comes TaxID=109280 RepID=UPI00094F107C|nr:PREDICTED: protein SCAF11 isoform X2 [Hippocampus comes]
MTGAESDGQGSSPDGSDAEEAERCPICLGVPARGELAMPDSCCHVFCLGCLLTWAEMVPSCPVDRRPFRNVYRWDGSLRCVQVPVSRQVAEPEAESCVCRSPGQRACLKSKLRKRSRQQRAEKMADSKTKGLVRKCNDDDPSSVSRKKVRGSECCAWPSSTFLSLATQDITEPVLVTEEISYEAEQCKRQVQECPWFSPAAPICAIGTSRFLSANSNHGPFTFELCSSPITSASSFGPGHFAFQGVVCAITCPKGGDKRGGRASNSKAPTKKDESLPSRRSGRNSKDQEESSVSHPSSPPQPSVSDSDSSASQASKAGLASQVAAKRKGKQVTNRKASGKRKNTRKKPSSEPVENQPASEDDEGDAGDGTDRGEAEDEAKPEMNNSDQPSDAEGSLNADHLNSDSLDGQQAAESLSSNMEHDTNDALDKDCHEQPEPDENNSHLSISLDSPPKSPESECSGKLSTQGEEPTVMSISTGDEEKITASPPSEPESTLDNLMSPDFDNVIEQDCKTEVGEERLDQSNDEEASRDLQRQSHESPKPASPCAEPSEAKVAEQEAKAFEGSETPERETPLVVPNLGEVVTNDDLSKDDTNVIPMDCSSPMSEAVSATVLEEAKEPAAAETSVSVPDERSKDQAERDPSHGRKNGRQRRSRFHSPTSAWSPKRDSRRESYGRSRSHSRERTGGTPSGHSSRPRSRERERERDKDRDYFRRERSRERRRRRSRSRSRSKSRSPSRTRSHRRGYSPERPASRDRSPRGKERRGGWRAGNGRDGRRSHGNAARFENGVPSETSPERQGWSENPDWVTEKTRGEVEGRNWDFGGGSRWEDRGPRGRVGFEQGRGAGRGGGNRGFHSQLQEDDNRRQPRSNSGMGNNSGNDAYSRFNENRGGGRRKPESDPGDSMLDRSGWSSASSWAVRRTLPADVQDYYSKRERGGAGSWTRPEEEQPAADPAKSEPAPTAPGNAPPAPVLTAMPPPPPPQLNVLHHHFPLQGPRGPVPVNLQPSAPYAVTPPIPVHLHPAVPLLQVPAVGTQGLPPPPPPPPPMQQGGQTTAAQPDGQITQMVNTMGAYGKAGLLSTPTKVGQQAANQVLPSSTTQPAQHHKAQADSSKKEKKQQIQEKAINEVKTAIKPYYQKKEITKDEYKEIVRKAVEKVCHSKSGEVNSSKVANLVKAYVDKYKHARKK